MVRMLKKCGHHRPLPDSVQDILPCNRGCFLYSVHTLVPHVPTKCVKCSRRATMSHLNNVPRAVCLHEILESRR